MPGLNNESWLEGLYLTKWGKDGNESYGAVVYYKAKPLKETNPVTIPVIV